MTNIKGRRDILKALVKITAIFAIVFLINVAWSFISGVMFMLIYTLKGNFNMDESRLLEELIGSPEFLFITCLYNVFAIAVTYLFWKKADKVNTDIIGLRWRKNSLRLFGLGILGGTIEMALIALLSLAMGTLWFESYGREFFSKAEILKSLFYGALAFLLVGFGEEALFRGYIQKRLMLAMGNRWALAVGSLIFMAAHIFTYGKLLDFIDVALGGAILGYLYILTDSLYLPAAYHFVYDLIQVNIVKLQEYEHYKGAVLFIFNNTGDIIVSGVNYGNIIEVSFVIAELAVLLMLYLFRDRIRNLARNI